MPTTHIWNKEPTGDVVMICTDGVASASDDRRFSYEEMSLVTISPGLRRMVYALAEWKLNFSPPTQEDLFSLIDNALRQMRHEKLAGDDDATAAILLTGNAIAYSWPLSEASVTKSEKRQLNRRPSYRH